MTRAALCDKENADRKPIRPGKTGIAARTVQKPGAAARRLSDARLPRAVMGSGNHTLMLRLPVSLKKSSMESTEVAVSTVEYAAALPKQSRMTSV